MSATSPSNNRIRPRAPMKGIASKATAPAEFNLDAHNRGTSMSVEAFGLFIGSLALGKAATYTETQNKVK